MRSLQNIIIKKSNKFVFLGNINKIDNMMALTVYSHQMILIFSKKRTFY